MGGEGEIELRQVFELEDFGESEAVGQAPRAQQAGCEEQVRPSFHCAAGGKR